MMMRGPFERTFPWRSTPRFIRGCSCWPMWQIPGLAGRAGSHGLRYRLWSESRAEESALLIAAAYKGHVDATINDQYGSVTGARRFINNIVQYPGCGSFFPAASLVADRPDGAWQV